MEHIFKQYFHLKFLTFVRYAHFQTEYIVIKLLLQIIKTLH